MKKITCQHIVLINKYYSDRSSIASSLDNPKLLEKIISTLYSVDSEGAEIYGDIYSKASKLLELFQSNQPFSKFNVSTGIYSMLLLFQINRIPMNIGLESINALYEGMDKKGFTYDDLVNWINFHKASKTLINKPKESTQS